MSTKKASKVIEEFQHSDLSTSFWMGFKATFYRNVKIIWQYKFTLFLGYVNTFAVSSLYSASYALEQDCLGSWTRVKCSVVLLISYGRTQSK